MVHLGLFLLAGGVIGAIIREQKNRVRVQKQLNNLPVLAAETDHCPVPQTTNSFDDVAELKHYQRVSWYGLALTSAGALFHPAATLAAVPVVGYNTFYFLKTLRHSTLEDQRSAFVVFECIGVLGTLLLSRPLIASIVMTLGFTKRNLLLQAGNISNNLNPSQLLNMRNNSVWVLRDGVEIEVLYSDLSETDTVVFHEGDTVILEGVVVEGEGEVNQFSLKKKMKVIPKKSGDRVFPFTYLVSGSLKVKKKA